MIQRDGGLKVGNTVGEMVEHMHKKRKEIFETE